MLAINSWRRIGWIHSSPWIGRGRAKPGFCGPRATMTLRTCGAAVVIVGRLSIA